MIDKVLGIIGQSISHAVIWFERVIIAMDAFDIVTIGVILGIVGRRLLKPIFGSSGSDKAKKGGVKQNKPSTQKGGDD